MTPRCWTFARAAVLSLAVSGVGGAAAVQPTQSGAALKARIEALVSEGAVSDALRLIEAHADAAGGAVDFSALSVLARGVLQRVAQSDEDPAASLEACLTLVASGGDPCEMIVVAAAAQSPIPVLRLRARAARLTGPVAQADRQLAQSLEGLSDRDWTAVVDAAGDFPVPTQILLLSRALVEAEEATRYAAVEALARIDDPAALPPLRSVASQEAAPGRLVALAALARSGDAAALSRITALLPELEGLDLLSAARALAAHQDPRGVAALQQIMAGPEELLQLEAAAALARLGDTRGRDRLKAELSNTNPWIRLRALEKLRPLPGPPTAAVWRQMDDPMAWIRVRAAQVSLAATPSGRPGIGAGTDPR